VSCTECIRFELNIYGITLILATYLLRRCLLPRNVMFSLFAFASTFARSMFRTSASAAPQSPAAVLMESACSRAGSDAHQAEELRIAASAWLSVVR
jgi:hypothetical protein